MLNIHLKAARGWRSSVLAVMMPSKGDGAGTDTFRPPHAYGQRRNTEKRQRLRGWHRGRCLYLGDLLPFLRVLYRLLPAKDFYDRRPLAA